MKLLVLIKFWLPVLGFVFLAAPAHGTGESLNHYIMGLQYAEEGDLDSAIRELRIARQLDPEVPELASELARLLIEARRAHEALEPAQDAVRLDPDNAESHWLLGQAYMLQSKGADAIPSLKRAWELARDDRNYQVTLVLALESEKRFEEALDLLLTEKGGVEPTTPYLLMRRAGLRNRLEEPQDALEDYLSVLEFAPRYPGAADHLLAVCWRMGPSRVTASACSRALDHLPERADIRRELVRILILLNRQDEAVPHLELLLADDPEDAPAMMQLGVIRFSQERLSEAIRLMRGVYELNPELTDSGDWLWRALSRADSVEAALEVATEMTERLPDSPEAAWYRANSLARLGRSGESLDALRRVHELDPNDREARLLAAILLEEEGDLEEAREQLKWILRTRPRDRETLFRLAVLAERQGRFDLSVEWFRRLIAAHPDDALALNYAGYLCAEQGIELHQALEWTIKATSIAPDNAAFVDSYGWVLYKLGRLEEAVEQLERAFELDSGEKEILIHLAKAYRAVGRVDEGRRLLRELLEEEPKEREARELLQLWDRGTTDTGNSR